MRRYSGPKLNELGLEKTKMMKKILARTILGCSLGTILVGYALLGGIRETLVGVSVIVVGVAILALIAWAAHNA